MIHSCPVCASRATEQFLTLTNVPVSCASVFGTREEALSVPIASIDLATCVSCGFAFNSTFDPLLGELGAQYESSQAASAHFGAYARAMATDWITRYGLAGKVVLEIGCGDGSFMRQLVACGAGRVIGVDPLVHKTDDLNVDQIQIVARAFDASQLHIAADALVCRHTLEHIQDVSGFLSVVRAWAAQDARRVVLMDIPDAERIFRERAFWDIYYEHCNYFTEQTVSLAFELAGLEVMDVRRVYGDQYLIVEARARAATDMPADPPASKSLLEEYQAFSTDVQAAISCCTDSIRELLKAQRPVLLWQGAAKTVGFMSALQGSVAIDGAIDLNPHRDGKFLPGSALPVLAPGRLPGINPRYVVLMNPVYLDEVRRSVAGLGSDAVVFPINELLTAGFVPALRQSYSTTR